MIGIRVDVNQEIATGHIKRDIAIALCLRKMGRECVFISADENCLSYLATYNFKSVILESAWDDMESELSKLEIVIKENNIESLLVDSYMVTEGYMQRLSEMTVVTYFDELGNFGYGCQQLINGVLEPPDYSNASGKALLGPAYVSLRQEFAEMPPKEIRSNLDKLMITSGGTDNYHFCKKFLDIILEQPQWNNLTIMVVIGEFSKDKELLQRLYGDNKRVELYINAQNMSELMQRADYVITAGGTTLYEVCAVGTAGSCYSIADNQLEIVQSFHNKGLIFYGGNFRNNPEETLKLLLMQMEQARDVEFRRAQAVKLQQLVDGMGAWRIAEALVNAPNL